MNTETTIATIGQNYNSSFFSGGKFPKTSVVLKENHISGIGRTNTSLQKETISFCGDLKSVSSIGLQYSSNYMYLILGILLLPAWGIGLVFIIGYFLSKQRYILINFQGAVYALDLKGISNIDVDSFINLSLIHI